MNNIIKCKKCGAEIDADSKICSICGSAIEAEDHTHLEKSIQKLRNNIIEAINATPLEKYPLASLFWKDAERCFPDGPYHWDLASFYINLRSRELFAEVSTYPNQFGACREATYRLSATEFHKKAIENDMSDLLKSFETEEDWQKLFDKDLNDAISNAIAKIQREQNENQEKKRKENAIKISNDIASQYPTMEFNEISITLTLAYAINTLTVQNKNDKYHAECASFSKLSYTDRSGCSKELSAAESVWLERKIESVLNNTDNSTWHSLPGGDKMSVVIKSFAGDIVDLQSVEPISKFKVFMDETEKLIKYGSITETTQPVETTKKCKQCGTLIEDDYKFCPTCGKALRS